MGGRAFGDGEGEHYGEGGRAFGDGEREHLVMGRESIW